MGPYSFSNDAFIFFSDQANDWYTSTDFVANRPFLFYIMDSELYICLVAGKVGDPTQTKVF